MNTTPTQVSHPARAVARTVFAVLVSACAVLPAVVSALGLDPVVYPIVGTILTVAGVVTRILAIPAVNDFIAEYLPFLAPAPAVPTAGSDSE